MHWPLFHVSFNIRKMMTFYMESKISKHLPFLLFINCHFSLFMVLYIFCWSCEWVIVRRGGAEVAGWTLDRKIRVRFPAYSHRVWALWWHGGKRRLRTSRCPCRGRLGTLKTPSCPWRGCPAAGRNLETGHLSRHYIAEISLNVTLNNKTTTTTTTTTTTNKNNNWVRYFIKKV